MLQTSPTAVLTQFCACIGERRGTLPATGVKLNSLPVCTLFAPWVFRLIPKTNPTCMRAHIWDLRLYEALFGSSGAEAPPPPPPFMLIPAWSLLRGQEGEAERGVDGSVGCRLLLLCIDEVPDGRDLQLKHHLSTASRLHNVVGEDARLRVNIGESSWKRR